MKALLGIDIGTSACKAVMIDTEGRILAHARIEYPTHRSSPGRAEQDPSHWVRASIRCANDVVAQAPVPGADVQAIGLSGQMHTLVPLSERGQVLRPAILWSDQRNARYVADLRQDLGHKLRRWTANPANGTMTLPTLLWLRDHEPLVWEQLAHVLMPKDYVRYCLCDDMATDPSDASGTLLYDPYQYQWSSEAVNAVGLPADILPPVRPSRAIAGFLNKTIAEQMGLREKLPVVTGGADVSCEALAAGVTDSETGLIRLGTAGVVCVAADKLILLATGATCYNHVLDGKWLIATGTQACGSVLFWARDLLVGSEQGAFEEFTDLAARVLPGSGGLLFLPHLCGERAPYWDPSLTGRFVGIRIEHDRCYFARAVLEGVAFSLRDSLTGVRTLQERIRRYVLIGGASANPLLCQILADVFSAPMHVRSWAEPALGAAMLAGLGCEIPFSALAGDDREGVSKR